MLNTLIHKFCFRQVFGPLNKINHLLDSTSDDLGPRCPGIYQVSCSCGLAYVGQTRSTVVERCEEHAWHIDFINMRSLA